MAMDAERLPPWTAVYQQTQRWLASGCFEALIDDQRAVYVLLRGDRSIRPQRPIDDRTLRSTPESGERTSYDGGKRKKGAKLHKAVHILGYLLALHVTPPNAEDRGEVEQLARIVQAVNGDNVDIAYVDQGYTGQCVTHAATAYGIRLEVVKPPEAKRAFVLLPW
jgi:transposase